MRNRDIVAFWLHSDQNKYRRKFITRILLQYNLKTYELDDLLTSCLKENPEQTNFDIVFGRVEKELKKRKEKKIWKRDQYKRYNYR
jgi:hypothetical protein